MKALKVSVAALAALFSISAAADYTPVANQSYNIVANKPSAQKEVIEFFSFYCPHCYNFEMNQHVPQRMRAALPKGAVLKQYHVNFLGAASEDLTRAWALAMVEGKEARVIKPLFTAAQAGRINSMNDIRKIFLRNGFSGKTFDEKINSFAVTALVNKQVQLAEAFKIQSVPNFVVNGRYQLNGEGIATGLSSESEFYQRYVDSAKFLINK